MSLEDLLKKIKEGNASEEEKLQAIKMLNDSIKEFEAFLAELEPKQ